MCLVDFQSTTKEQESERANRCAISNICLACFDHFMIAAVATVQLGFFESDRAWMKVNFPLSMALKGTLAYFLVTLF